MNSDLEHLDFIHYQKNMYMEKKLWTYMCKVNIYYLEKIVKVRTFVGKIFGYEIGKLFKKYIIIIWNEGLIEKRKEWTWVLERFML